MSEITCKFKFYVTALQVSVCCHLEQHWKVPFTLLIHQQELQNATVTPDVVQCINLSLLSIIYCLHFHQKGSLCIQTGSKTVKYYGEVQQGKFPGRGFLSVYRHGQSTAREFLFGTGCKQFTLGR